VVHDRGRLAVPLQTSPKAVSGECAARPGRSASRLFVQVDGKLPQAAVRCGAVVMAVFQKCSEE
jgi:hypothetical protein